jgi:hypothetical protein
MGDVLIPIVAITTSIGLPAIVIVIALFVYHKRKLAKYQVLRKPYRVMPRLRFLIS